MSDVHEMSEMNGMPYPMSEKSEKSGMHEMSGMRDVSETSGVHE